MVRGTDEDLIAAEPGVWKQKAIERRLELKELNKRRKELVTSRENWKSKYMAEKQRADNYEKELGAIKKKLNEIIAD
jgi:hypothetical protein